MRTVEHDNGLYADWESAVLVFLLRSVPICESSPYNGCFGRIVVTRHHYRSGGTHRLCRGAVKQGEEA